MNEEKKLKKDISLSFRVKIITYAISSMLLAVLTVIAMSLLVRVVFTGTKKVGRTFEKAAIESEISSDNAKFSGNMSIMQEPPKAPDEERVFEEEEIQRERGVRLEREVGLIRVETVVELIGILILFVVYFLLMSRKYSAYLFEITDCMERIAAGDHDVRIPKRMDSELTIIAEGINSMNDEAVRMMERERDTEAAKNELITSVAHDLRTPLTSIIGYLELINRKNDLPVEKKFEYAGIAYEKSKRLERLIEDLFSFTKVSFGQMSLHRSRIDMIKLVEQILDEFYPALAKSELELIFDNTEKIVIMNVDGDLMARAVANLISNAIKYGKDGKKLRVALVNTQDYFEISITNYGKMIPKEDLQHIFDKFYRVESSRSMDTGGTGLGLAITQNIIRMHDGKIDVRSDHDGTVFAIRLKHDEEEEDEEQG